MKLRAMACLDCGKLTRNGSRCVEHERVVVARRDQQRGTPTARGYGYAWRKLSRAVLERDGYVCWLCGGPGADTADHVVPKARGGSDDMANLRGAHRSCNARKKDR